MSSEAREPSAKYLAQTDYQSSDIGPIPRDWTLSTVGDEFNVQLGKMLDADRNVGIEKPYLGNRAVQWGRIDVTDVQNIRLTKADLEKFRLQRGDLLVCEGGEVGRAAIWNAEIAECYYQKALHRLRPLRGYEPSLMLALLQLYANRGVLSNYVTQTSIAHLPKEKFVAIPIPRPEPEEQRAIAAALSDIDALIAGLEKLIAKKRDLKQAAMQQLLTGQTRLPGFRGEWVVKRLGDLANVAKGRGLSKGQLAGSGANPCILYGELFTTYERVISSVVSKTNSSEGLAGLRGDVLLPGSTTTKAIDLAVACALLADDVQLGGDINVVRMKSASSYDPIFMANLLTHTQKLAIADLAQGSTIIHLYGRALLNLKLKLPVITEQAAIATVLSDMDTEITSLESRLAKTHELKQGMMQELLTGRTRLV